MILGIVISLVWFIIWGHIVFKHMAVHKLGEEEVGTLKAWTILLTAGPIGWVLLLFVFIWIAYE